MSKPARSGRRRENQVPSPEAEVQKFKFRLYIAGASRNSQLARGNLDAICSSLPSGSWDLEVVDVLANPRGAMSANILVTPTLDFTCGGATRRVVGTFPDGMLLRRVLGLPLDSQQSGKPSSRD